MILNLFRRSVVPVYRTVSLITLYTILAGIIGYGTLVAFYLGSSAWVAPFAVNSSDTTVLEIMSQITASKTALTALNLDYDQTNDNLKFSKEQLDALAKLQHSFDLTSANQQKVWAQSAQDLTHFDGEAHQNIAMLQKDVNNGDELRHIINQDLAAGLITKADAAVAIANIDTLASSTTASKVAETALVDNIRQHQMVDMSNISIEAQRAQIIFQMGQLESAIRVDQDHMAMDKKMIAVIDQAITTAKQSPYYIAMNSPEVVQFAVAPYSNGGDKIKIGQPVYDCVFGLAACRKTGTVTAVFPNELVFENPLTKTNMRGYLIQVEVSEVSLRSKSLVVGHKPLLF